MSVARPARVRDDGTAVDVTALIDRYDAAWNAQDVDLIAGMHDDAIVFENHTAGERAEGAAEVRAHIARIFERWPTLRFERRALRCGADFAVSEWTAHATHPDDGRRLEWDGVDVFPLTPDGRIARKDVYSTSATPRTL
jgi:ketosteroid isomerase-like protein